MERLDDWLGGVNRVPSLLHGDLWAGNFIVAANDEPVIFDPAVYYGDREVEIAFTELFGGFPSGFLTAYCDNFPPEPGYDRRRGLYQLYPLLVHFNLFGEPYGAQIDTICRLYL
jgi:fructosamine-3-kinase